MSKKKTLQESDSKQYLVVTREGKKYLAFLRDEEKSALVSQGATVEDPATGQNNTSSIMGEEQAEGDYLTLGMQLGKALAAALRDHGDSIEGLFLKDSSKNGCTLRVRYRPDDDGAKWEDEFVIEYSGDPDAKAYLVNGEDRVELCAITQQSGSAQINKDLAKAAFTNFIDKKTDIGKSDIKASDPDITGGQPIDECGEGEMLWEENGDQQFCEAAKAWYSHKTKDGLKSLFKAARNFKKGNTLEEKFANAVAWYKDPANRVNVDDKKKYYKNTKKQVFSGNGFEDMSGVSGMRGSGDASADGAAVEESMPKANIDPVFDSEGFDIYKDFLTPVTACLEKLKAHINKTEDTWVGSYYATIYRAVENLSNFVQKYDKPESLDEVGLRSESECLSVDMPLFIRLLEYAKEDAKSDVDLHMVAENLQTICNEGGCADMSDYNKIVPEEAGEDSEEKPLSEAKIIENYNELFKKFLNNFELKELAETWEKIYPEHYNALKDTVLYPYANIIEHILMMKGVISAADGKIVSRPWEEEDDCRGADVAEILNEAVDGISEEDITEAFKAFREVEQQGYQDPWFRGHAPGKVDLTCIAYNGDYKFIWDVPAEMDEEEVVTSTGKIYELDITFPNGKTINMNESSLEKRNFYNEEERA